MSCKKRRETPEENQTINLVPMQSCLPTSPRRT
jgi:hypothetical protein